MAMRRGHSRAERRAQVARPGRRLPLLALAVAVAVVLALAPAAAAPAFPTVLPLPDGFYPEGIAVGAGHDFFVGSLLDGAVYRGDLRTGRGEVLVPGVEGRFVVGLAFDGRSGLVWAAGAAHGQGRALAFDAATGELVHEVPIGGVFLNDLVVARDALYLTDSLAPRFYRLPLDARGEPAGPARAVPLSGDFAFVDEGELPINLNGIEVTPDGRHLVAVHTTLGVLYRIDPHSGVARKIDLAGATLPFGDGLLLHGRNLYVVQNFANQVAVVALAADLRAGSLVATLTSADLRVPTTAALHGDRLYLVNARFDAAFPPFLGADPVVIDYDVVSLRRSAAR
jgi:hypothetical protein